MSNLSHQYCDLDFVNQAMPQEVPFPWRIVDRKKDGFFAMDHDMAIVSMDRLAYFPGLHILVTGASEVDGRRWIHIAISRFNYRPTGDDVREVKNTWLGPEALAFELHHPKEIEEALRRREPNTVHLFRCLDGMPIPSFTSVLQGPVVVTG